MLPLASDAQPAKSVHIIHIHIIVPHESIFPTVLYFRKGGGRLQAGSPRVPVPSSTLIFLDLPNHFTWNKILGFTQPLIDINRRKIFVSVKRGLRISLIT